MDPELLKRLRAEADAVRNDIEERERLFDADPIRYHDEVMRQANSAHVPHLEEPTENFDYSDPPPLSDEALDVIAGAIAEMSLSLRQESKTPQRPCANASFRWRQKLTCSPVCLALTEATKVSKPQK